MPWRSSTLDSAKMLRTSSSTTSTRLPRSASSDSCRRCTMRCLAGGRSAITRCRNSAVSSSRRSGDSTPLMTTLFARLAQLRVLVGAEFLAGEHDDRHVVQRRLAPGCARAGRSRSCRAGAGRARRNRSCRRAASRSASAPVADGVDVDVVVARSAPRCSCRSAASSSTTSRRFARGSVYCLMRSSASLDASRYVAGLAR